MFLDEKKVFRDVEYYLPQLTHVIVHFDQYNKVQALEKFLVLLSQTSIHISLQIMFILGSFMEDYQPELPDGKVNPQGDSFYYTKCARLLVDVERAAVYGNSQLSEAERDMIKNADHASQTLETSSIDIEDLKRTEIAEELTRNKSDALEGHMSGELLYKRVSRKSLFHTKGWKTRYFVVENKCLMCYREQFSPDSLRAMFLQYCRIEVPENHKYPDQYFEVINDHTHTVFQLRANSKEERDNWVSMLQKEIQGAPAAFVLGGDKAHSAGGMADVAVAATAAKSGTGSGSSVLGDDDLPQLQTQNSSIVEGLLSTSQRKNFRIIQQQQLFIVNLTNICEGLRFRERAVRKFLLRGAMTELVVPPFAYIPLCSSQDAFATILRALPEEAHAFTTKARVPCLMLFELQEHPTKCDIATFFGLQLDSYAEEEIVCDSMTLLHKCSQVSSTTEVTPVHTAPAVSRFNAYYLGNTETVWKPHGTGQRRLSTQLHSPQAVGSRPTSIESCGSTPGSAPCAEQEDIQSEDLLHSPCIGERFEDKAARVLAASPNVSIPNRKLGGLIAKSNDDVRQEVFVVQLIAFYRHAFMKAKLPLWLKQYRILSCSKSTGLIELIPNTSSLDGLKKHPEFPGSLRAYFEQTYGYDAKKKDPESPAFKKAIENYIASMAAYSVITYLLAIKDRHNGNVMLDADGHIIHIDFGFVFGLGKLTWCMNINACLSSQFLPLWTV